MELSSTGFTRFSEVENFRKYECNITHWSANLLLGISRLPIPFFITSKDTTCKIYLNDQEYETLLIFLNNDFEIFIQSFLKDRG